MIMINSPKIILFDWDNTLVNSWNKLHKCINHTFRHFSVPEWSLEETKANMHISLVDSFPKVFGERWIEAKQLYYNCYDKIYSDIPVDPLKDAELLLKELQINNIGLGIVSNKCGDFLRKEVEALKWKQYFNAVIGSTDAAKDKPNPDPVFLALSKIPQKAIAKEIWFVGDTIVDMECAVNSGCYPIFFGNPGTATHPNERGYAHTHVMELKDLRELFQKHK